MICVITLCAILSGTVRQCAPDSMEAFYIDEPQSRAECREVFSMLQHVLPANLRLVQFDWYKPQPQTTRRKDR